MSKADKVMLLSVAAILLAATGFADEGAKVADERLLDVLPPERGAPAFTEAQNAQGFALWWGDHASPFYERMPPSEADLAREPVCQSPPGEHEPLVLGIWGLRDLGASGLWVRETPFALKVMTVQYQDRAVPPPPVEGRRRVGIPEWLPEQATARIEAGRNTVFWIDVSVPEDAKPGDYQGLLWLVVHEREIVDKDTGGRIFKIPFTVKVLPIKLPRAKIAFGMYFRPGATTLQREAYRTREMLETYYRDMAAHGMTSATVYVYGGNFHDQEGNVVLEGKPDALVIDAMRDAGLVRPDVPIMLLGGIGNLSADKLKALAPKLAAAAKERGWPELLYYGPDEPTFDDERGKRCIEVFAQLQPLRPAVRIVTAISGKSAEYFAKDLDVWEVHNGEITPDLARLCRERGDKMWTYDCRHRGTNPTFNRFYPGLYTWALGLKGNFLWCYTEHYSWEGDRFAVFNYVLPGLAGPVSSVGWEERREGVEDYRTLTMLEDCIAKKPSEAAAQEAKAWLDALRKRVDWNTWHSEPPTRYGWDAPDLYSQCPNFAPTEFNEIRTKAREYVIALEAAPTP
ncbi:MAG: glycoside hydrolase domain-containing protein [Planctomycetota bacterium]